MSDAELKFVILSDLHLAAPGRRLYGLDPFARLEAAIAAVNREHADIAFVLFAGDLTHWGERAAYDGLAKSLEALRAPAILTLGNHDGRAAFRAAFPGADDDGAGFVQALRVFPQASLITLDTLDEEGGTSAGRLGAARLGFLERALGEAPTDRPLLICQHHPSRAVGLPGMDSIRLLDADEQWAVFERAGRRPDWLLHGHAHRPIVGDWRGVPFHIQRGLSHQVAFEIVDPKAVDGTYEPPDYAFVTVGPQGVAIHHVPFLYDGPLFSLSDPEAVEGRFGGGD